MSDERWTDIEADTTAAVNHFSRAIQIYRGPGLHDCKFRHVAVRAYDTFDPDDAEPAVRAAEKVAAGFAAAIAAYRQAVDPPA